MWNEYCDCFISELRFFYKKWEAQIYFSSSTFTDWTMECSYHIPRSSNHALNFLKYFLISLSTSRYHTLSVQLLVLFFMQQNPLDETVLKLFIVVDLGRYFSTHISLKNFIFLHSSMGKSNLSSTELIIVNRFFCDFFKIRIFKNLLNY